MYSFVPEFIAVTCSCIIKLSLEMSNFSYSIDSSTTNVQVQAIVSLLSSQILPFTALEVFAVTHIPEKQPVMIHKNGYPSGKWRKKLWNVRGTEKRRITGGRSAPSESTAKVKWENNRSQSKMGNLLLEAEPAGAASFVTAVHLWYRRMIPHKSAECRRQKFFYMNLIFLNY